MSTHHPPSSFAAPAGAVVSLSDPALPDLAAPDPAALPHPRHDGWSAARQVAFLRALAATHNVSHAARSVGMSRQSAYKLRARLRGEPFDLAWAEAFQCCFDALAHAAMERALNGVEVPHYYKGELVGTSRRFDERLTLGLLAMRNDLRPPSRPSWHPASGFEWGEFAALLERVEDGPETWEEEREAEREALYAELEEEEEDDEVESDDAGEGPDEDNALDPDLGDKTGDDPPETPPPHRHPEPDPPNPRIPGLRAL